VAIHEIGNGRDLALAVGTRVQPLKRQHLISTT
jgi:hypothetical protein